MGIFESLLSYNPFKTNSTNLNGKLVLITGGSSGIGLGFCELVLKAYPQVKLVVVDLNKPSFDCTFIKCDLSKAQEVKKVFKDIAEKQGIPDVFILNAGIQHAARLDDVTDEQYERIIDVNFKNSFYSVKPFLKGFKERKSGHLVFTCSVASFISAPFGVPYCASKAGALSLANGIRSELIDYNIKVSTLTPGHIKTKLFPDFKVKYNWFMPSLEPGYVSNSIFDIVQHNESQQWMRPLYSLLLPLLYLLPPELVIKVSKVTGGYESLVPKEFTAVNGTPQIKK